MTMPTQATGCMNQNPHRSHQIYDRVNGYPTGTECAGVPTQANTDTLTQARQAAERSVAFLRQTMSLSIMPDQMIGSVVADAVLSVPSVASALTLRQMVIDGKIVKHSMPPSGHFISGYEAGQRDTFARLRAVVEETPL